MNPMILMPAQAAGENPLGFFVPMVAMFAIFYFLVLRPQMRRQKQHDALVKALSPKDKVIMNCGLYGTVVKVQDNDIIVEVADKVHMKFQRNAVGVVRSPGGDESKS